MTGWIVAGALWIVFWVAAGSPNGHMPVNSFGPPSSKAIREAADFMAAWSLVGVFLLVAFLATGWNNVRLPIFGAGQSVRIPLAGGRVVLAERRLSWTYIFFFYPYLYVNGHGEGEDLPATFKVGGRNFSLWMNHGWSGWDSTPLLVSVASLQEAARETIRQHQANERRREAEHLRSERILRLLRAAEEHLGVVSPPDGQRGLVGPFEPFEVETEKGEKAWAGFYPALAGEGWEGVSYYLPPLHPDNVGGALVRLKKPPVLLPQILENGNVAIFENREDLDSFLEKIGGVLRIIRGEE